MTDRRFVWNRRVGFGDCDPARIAYTGRIPEFALEAIDAFWESLLGGDNWFTFNVDQGIGTPFVNMQFDFRAPITPRNPLELLVAPVALGASSIRFAVTGSQAGILCFESTFVCVFVALPEVCKIPVPHRIRTALQQAYPTLAFRT